MSDTAGALGLLGTIWGMYTTFIGGNLQPEQILSGMGIALVTTLLGLIVSIILNVFSTGVVKMFSNRLDLIEYAGDIFRGQFAETNTVAGPQNQSSVLQQPVSNLMTQNKTRPEMNIQMLAQRIPTKLMILSGDNQAAEVSSQLPTPLEVQVLDQDEAGLAKQKVVFQTNGSGCLFSNGKNMMEVATDSRGRAKVNLKLGKSVGAHMIKASLNGRKDIEPLIEQIQVVSKSGQPYAIKELPGSNHQVAFLKEKLPTELGVRVQDEFGNPNQDILIVFKVVTSDVIANSGRFENRKSEIVVKTNTDGIATTPFWVGEEVGPNVVHAKPKIQTGNAPQAIFYATGKDS